MTQFSSRGGGERQKNSTQKTGSKMNSRGMHPTLTGMDCLYLAVVFVTARVKTFTGCLRDKIRVITMNNSTAFPLVTTSSQQK